MLFAQLMDFLPWTSFARSVARYGGDRRVRNLSCAEQFRAMAFAQLTYRESLRDIEACLNAQPAKLYPMGFRSPVRRSTLAEANESRDWRIYAELAQRLMLQARKLYAKEDLGMDLDAAAYALDSTTIDLCLSLFPWAHFRSTKSAVKMHTLLDLRGNEQHLFRVLPKRWIVERTFAWLNWSRRLSKDYELRHTSAESMIHIAFAHMLLRRSP